MQKRRKLARGVAIVGAGMSKFGMYKDKDSKDLFAEAFNGMIASVDKGIDPHEIDALYLGNFSNDFFMHQSHWGPIISDLIGLTPKPATRTEGACASSALAFREGVFAIAPPFMIEQGYNRKNPYCSGVVELEEGGRVDARIEGVDCAKPEDIKVGMPLKVKYLHREEGDQKETYLAFEPE
jgi:hypothetical protein